MAEKKAVPRKPLALSLPRELGPLPQRTVKSCALHLYMAADEEFQCCLCPARIVSRDMYHFLIQPEGVYRRAHVECAQKTLCQVIEKLDKKGLTYDRGATPAADSKAAFLGGA